MKRRVVIDFTGDEVAYHLALGIIMRQLQRGQAKSDGLALRLPAFSNRGANHMAFAPIEGEFWIVEIQATNDPDYYGPFESVDAARAWGRSKGWYDFVTIHVWPPSAWTHDTEDE